MVLALVIAIGVQLWYWRNALSLGVELPRTLKVLMVINISVLSATTLVVAWYGYSALASGEM
jgi:hypothetical protein